MYTRSDHNPRKYPSSSSTFRVGKSLALVQVLLSGQSQLGSSKSEYIVVKYLQQVQNQSKHKTAGFSTFMSFQYIQYSVQKEGVLCLRSIHRGVIKSFDVESMGNVGTQLSDNATLNNMPLSMLYIPVLHIGCPFHPLSQVVV